MRHWHKCRRWTIRGLQCPLVGPRHEELSDEEDDEGEEGEKFPVLVPAKAKTPSDPQGKVVQAQIVEILKEAEAWQQVPEPKYVPEPVLPPPARRAPKRPAPTVPEAPRPVVSPVPLLFAAESLPDRKVYVPPATPPVAAVVEALIQPAFEGLYKAGITDPVRAAKAVADGLVKAPAPTTAPTPPPVYYGRGPEEALKPVAASVETALAASVATYKPITQPSAISTFIENVQPYVKPAVIGATAAGAGGFFFNWASRLKTMQGSSPTVSEPGPTAREAKASREAAAGKGPG